MSSRYHRKVVVDRDAVDADEKIAQVFGSIVRLWHPRQEVARLPRRLDAAGGKDRREQHVTLLVRAVKLLVRAVVTTLPITVDGGGSRHRHALDLRLVRFIGDERTDGALAPVRSAVQADAFLGN